MSILNKDEAWARFGSLIFPDGHPVTVRPEIETDEGTWTPTFDFWWHWTGYELTAPKAASPLKPSATLLTKLGRMVVLAEQMADPNYALYPEVYKAALDGFADPEVRQWLEEMADYALVPRRQKDETKS